MPGAAGCYSKGAGWPTANNLKGKGVMPVIQFTDVILEGR
jgi:hypothetical protein